jgi:hypothetical protein
VPRVFFGAPLALDVRALMAARLSGGLAVLLVVSGSRGRVRDASNTRLKCQPIAAHCEPYSASCSNTSQAARSRLSGKYLFDALVNSILSRNGVARIPGRFRLLVSPDSVAGLTFVQTRVRSQAPKEKLTFLTLRGADENQSFL